MPPGSSVSGMVNALTIDVEDYFHASALAAAAPRLRWDDFPSRVVSNTEALLALLERHHVTATFFVLGWVAHRYPALVRRIANAKHEIGSHGFGHELAYDTTPEAFRDDVRRTKTLLEDLTGQSVLGYRAPSFSITGRSLWTLDVLVEEGYTYDSSIFPVHHDRYGIPNAPRHAHWLQRPSGRLAELPLSTVRVAGMNLPIAGGGYFRLFHYGLTAWGISHVNRIERKPVIFYLHPWEVDPDQPRLEMGRLSRFRHYHNLHRTTDRLERLLRQFRFAPARSVFSDFLGLPEPREAPSAAPIAIREAIVEGAG